MPGAVCFFGVGILKLPYELTSKDLRPSNIHVQKKLEVGLASGKPSDANAEGYPKVL